MSRAVAVAVGLASLLSTDAFAGDPPTIKIVDPVYVPGDALPATVFVARTDVARHADLSEDKSFVARIQADVDKLPAPAGPKEEGQ